MRPSFLDRIDSGQRATIVVYGTSLSAEKCAFWRRTGGAWVTHLRRVLLSNSHGLVTVANAAKWGSDSKWGLKRLRSRVLIHEPDAVLLEFSVNDADTRRGTSMTRSRQYLLAMIQEIREHSNGCDVVLMTMNPAFGRPLSHRPRLDDYYRIYREVAEDQCLLLVDHMRTWRQLLARDPEMSDCFPDGLHPNQTACERVIMPNVVQTLQLSALVADPKATDAEA